MTQVCLLQHGLFINVHLVTGKASPVVASGLVNTVDSINNPMVKFNLIVPVIGQNIDAKLKCSLQLICEYHEIQTYSQMVMVTIIIKVSRETKVDFCVKNQLKLLVNGQYIFEGNIIFFLNPISKFCQAHAIDDKNDY